MEHFGSLLDCRLLEGRDDVFFLSLVLSTAANALYRCSLSIVGGGVEGQRKEKQTEGKEGKEGKKEKEEKKEGQKEKKDKEVQQGRRERANSELLS